MKVGISLLFFCEFVFFLSILNSNFIFKVKFSLLNYVIFVHYPIRLYYVVAILPTQEINKINLENCMAMTILSYLGYGIILK